MQPEIVFFLSAISAINHFGEAVSEPSIEALSAVITAHRRLARPSSHTRLLPRVVVLDVLWSGASPLAAFVLRDGAVNSPNGVAVYCGVAFLVSLLVFQWFETSSPIARYYSIRDALDLIKACVVIAALAAASSFLLTRLEEAPRSIPILHFILLASGLLGARLLLRLRDTRRETRPTQTGGIVEHIVIIAASRLAWFFSKMVEELAPGDYQIVAILDERPQFKHRSLNGYPIVGPPADLEKVIADYAMHGVRIDKVVVAARAREIADKTWEEISRVCRTAEIGLEILPERLMSNQAEDAEDVPFGPQPEATIQPDYLQLDRSFWKIKRAIDVVVATTVALLFLPVVLVICGLVLCDVGIPIVFWQQRIGRHGAPLHLYKFRTMQTLFDRRTGKQRLVQRPSLIGRFLQRSRLDELPQLWNVISGDMSLIGPRPLLPADQPADVSLRLSVRPGLTGWAQVCGGKAVMPTEKAALDEWYIRHASLWRDISIVVRTIRMLCFTGDRRNEEAIDMAMRGRSASDTVRLDIATAANSTPMAALERAQPVSLRIG